MNIEVIGFCDYAQENFGKLTVVGVFNAINVRSFPAVHPQMAFVVRLRCSITERGKHAISVSYESSLQMHRFPPFETVVDVTANESSSTPVQFIHYFLQTQLHGPDTIIAVVKVDGKEVAQSHLTIARA